MLRDSLRYYGSTSEGPKNKAANMIKGTMMSVAAGELLWGVNATPHFEKIIDVDDCDKALSRLRREKRDWSLIISSWEANGNPAVDMVQQIRNSNADYYDIPIYFLISNVNKDEYEIQRNWALEEGVDGIIDVPFTIVTFKDKVEALKTAYHASAEIRQHLKTVEAHIRHQKYDYALKLLGFYEHNDAMMSYAHRLNYLIGRALELKGNDNDTETRYKKALVFAKNKLYAQARNALIDLYIKKNAHQKALFEVQEAITHSPYNPRWTLLNGKLQLILGKNNDGMTILNKLKKAHPSLRFEVENTITLYSKESGINVASVVDDKVLTEYIEKAKGYVESGLFQEAVKCYAMAAQIDPKNTKRYYAAIGSLNYRWYTENKSTGKADIDLKPLGDAVTYLLDAVKLDPDFADVYKLMSKIYTAEKLTIPKALNSKEILEVEHYLRMYAKMREDQKNQKQA